MYWYINITGKNTHIHVYFFFTIDIALGIDILFQDDFQYQFM